MTAATRYAVPDSVQLRQVAEAAAEDVAPLLRGAFRSVMTTEQKRDFHDLVTEFDRESERRIVARILADVPDSAIVGEEGGRRGSGSVEWHIDPIDGTSNFVRGLPFWCVSIAAVVDGSTVAAVVSQPVTGEVFAADAHGATLSGRPMRVAPSATEAGAVLVSSFPNAADALLLGNEAWALQLRLLDRFQTVRNLGSAALNLAYVAAGWADATFGLRTHSWDIAAGAFLVRQAGGRFVPLREGREVEQDIDADDYVAFGGEPYPTLMEELLHASSLR